MSKRGRKLKEYKTYLNNIPKEADIMSAPVVQYKENGDMEIVTQLPVGYFI